MAELRALVQGGGSALRMSAGRLRSELESSPALQRLVNRYLHALMAQIKAESAQFAARLQTAEAREAFTAFAERRPPDFLKLAK